jgi:hypothetical protein
VRHVKTENAERADLVTQLEHRQIYRFVRFVVDMGLRLKRSSRLANCRNLSNMNGNLGSSTPIVVALRRYAY